MLSEAEINWRFSTGGMGGNGEDLLIIWIAAPSSIFCPELRFIEWLINLPLASH